MTMMPSKTCVRCGVTTPATEQYWFFHYSKRKRADVPLGNICRSCRTKQQRLHIKAKRADAMAMIGSECTGTLKTFRDVPVGDKFFMAGSAYIKCSTRTAIPSHFHGTVYVLFSQEVYHG